MNPNALSPAIADLFLPDPSSEAGSGIPGDGSPVDAEQFDAYLQAARRSVSVELPTGASPSVDHRQPLERPARPVDRSEPGRTERTERPESRDRSEPVERDVVERDDRPARTEEAEVDREANSNEKPTAGEDDTSGSKDESAPSEVEGEQVEEVPTSDHDIEAEAVVAEVVVDTTVELPVAVAVEEIEVVDGDEATFSVEPIDATIETDVVVDQPTARSADVGANDAIAAVASPIASQVNAGQQADSSGQDEVSTVEVDLGSEGTTAEGEVAEVRLDQGEVASTDQDQDQEAETTDNAEGETRSDTRSDRQAGDRPAEAMDSTAVDGEDGADPMVGPAPVAVARSTQGQGTSNAAVNPIGRIEGARSRATVTAPAAAQAQGPVVEGDASDPLWLQVRRAMSSVRSLANGEQQVTVRLRPAELGSVVVRINTNDQGTVVSLVADSAVAATQLNQQRQLLVSELEQGGLSSVAVDVGTGETLADAQTDRSDDQTDDGAGSQAGAAVAGASGLTNRSTNRRRGRANAGGLVDVDL